MKSSPTLLAVLLLSPLVQLLGEDLATLDGNRYLNIKISSEKPDSIKVIHDGGVSTIAKKLLPPAFIAQHELSPPPVVVTSPEVAAKQALLNKFIVDSPSFVTKDGREFRSSRIIDVEPSGLHIATEGGSVRVKFIDLPEKVREAFHYNAHNASEYDAAQVAKNRAATELNQRMANAASLVDLGLSHVRLLLLQNVGKGWLCDMDVLKDVQEEVVTAHQGSALSAKPTRQKEAGFGRIGSRPSPVAPQVTYETTQVQKTIVLANLGRVMVFGLPDYNSLQPSGQGERFWSGNVYRIGKCGIIAPAADGRMTRVSIDAYDTSRSKAIKLVAMNGSAKQYTTEGEPEQAARPRTFGGTGTGFAITADGYIGTAAHVVNGATDVSIAVAGIQVPAKIVIEDTAHDLAILKVDKVATKPLVLKATQSLHLGDDLFTIGFPLSRTIGVNPKFTKGSLSSLTGLRDDPNTIQISVPIQHGNSGGPVCDSTAKVVGIVASLLKTSAGGEDSTPQNVNWAVKAELLIALAAQVPGLELSKPPATPAADITPEQQTEQAVYLITSIYP